MPKVQSNKKSLSARQAQFIESIEALGDILVFQTKRKKNADVFKGLKGIGEILNELFSIRKDDPEKFERLMLSGEFFETYEKDQEGAGFLLSIRPERYLLGFSFPVNQIIRIHEAAIETKNREASHQTTLQLIGLLGDFSTTAGNDIFVEELLRNIFRVAKTASDTNDPSAIEWYASIVFGRGSGDEPFNLSYLKLFDRCLVALIKEMVTENDFELFKALIKSFIDNFSVSTHPSIEIWTYAHLLSNVDFAAYQSLDTEHGIERRINELASSEREMDSQEKLDDWLGKFMELENILQPQLASRHVDQAEEMAARIKEAATDQFKYNNLLEIVFGIGAYCLAKKKFEWIHFMWEYKQPSDSDMSWMGHDIVPKTLEEAVQFYFRKAFFERRVDFSEDHHGMERYYKEYFLLMLMRLLSRVQKSPQTERYLQMDSFTMPELSIYALSDMTYFMDGFIDIARSLKNQPELFERFGFDPARRDEMFDEKLIPFLSLLKTKAEERIETIHRTQHIDADKVNEFKNQVLKSFGRAQKIRDVLDHYNLHVDRLDYVARVPRRGIHILDDKAVFFRQWHVTFGEWGENYGTDLARIENMLFIQRLAGWSTAMTETQLDETLTGNPNLATMFILATNGGVSFFRGKAGFKPQWRRDIQMEKIDIPAFEGWYDIGGASLPIFSAFEMQAPGKVFLLDSTKLGKLVQFSPLNVDDPVELKKDIFMMSIKDLAEHPDLIDTYIAKPPQWLSDVGDEAAQRKHLQAKAIINLSERFLLSRQNDFEGHVLTIPD